MKKLERNWKHSIALSQFLMMLFMLFLMCGVYTLKQENTIWAILFFGFTVLAFCLWIYCGLYFRLIIDYYVSPKAFAFLKKYEIAKPLDEEDKIPTLENIFILKYFILEGYMEYVSDEGTDQTKLRTTKKGIALMKELIDNKSLLYRK